MVSSYQATEPPLTPPLEGGEYRGEFGKADLSGRARKPAMFGVKRSESLGNRAQQKN